MLELFIIWAVITFVAASISAIEEYRGYSGVALFFRIVAIPAGLVTNALLTGLILQMAGFLPV